MTTYVPTDAYDMSQIVYNIGFANDITLAITDSTYSFMGGGIPDVLQNIRAIISKDSYNNNSIVPNIDSITALNTACRTLEKTIASSWTTALNPVLNALDTYVTAQTGSSFRNWYNASTDNRTINVGNSAGTWSGEYLYFQKLWRQVKNNELIVVLDSMTNTTGSWAHTNENSSMLNEILLETPMAIRAGSTNNRSHNIGANPIIVNVLLTHLSGSTEVATIHIPANTVAGTVFPIVSSTTGSTNKFVSLSVSSITGGTDGDVVEFWVA